MAEKRIGIIELVDNIAKESGVAHKDADKIVRTVFDDIRKAVEKGNRVTVQGFGSFRQAERAGREGTARTASHTRPRATRPSSFAFHAASDSEPAI